MSDVIHDVVALTNAPTARLNMLEVTCVVTRLKKLFLVPSKCLKVSRVVMTI